ncbi:MAG: TonB-dependent receptor [Gemmatimonadaceae bacterium]|nr:TonB-dependent receptor [Gemmatimonadaceae bacterium]
MRLLTLVPIALLAAPLAAQSRPDTTTAASLPKVTVSATRSTTPLLLAPLAVTSVGIERLRATSGIGLADALQGIPGVLAQSRSSGVDTRITIRGFGARGAGDRSNAGTMRGIRVMVDGIPETEPDGRTSLDLIDLAAMTGVDVIRSNASALWGNAAGGIIALSSTPLPGTQVDARTMAGSFGLRRAIAQTSHGTGDSRAYVGVSRTESDGWRQNSTSDRSLLSSGLVSPLGSRTRIALRLSAAQNNFGIPGPLTIAEASANPRAANTTYNARRERRENQIIRFGTSLDRSVGERGVLSVMSYVTPKTLIRSERGTYREFNRVHGGGGINLRETLGMHTFIVGADVQHQDGPAKFWSLSAAGEKGTTLQQDKNESATTGGLFIQDEWTLTPRLSLSLGARYDALRYGLTDRITPRLSATRNYSQLSPKLGASYRLSGNNIFYANLGAGVETPAGNETDPAGTFGQDTVTGISPLLKPIRSLTYEVGTRQVLALTAPGTKSLKYEVSLFNTDVRDELVPYRGGRFYFNAGKARRQGIELGGELELDEGVAFRSTATLMRATYLEYTVDSVHYGRPGRLADYSGNAVVGVPRSMGSIGARWDAPMMPLRFDADMQYTGEYTLNDANSISLPSSTLFNATISLRKAQRLFGRVGVTGFVRVENLLDRRYMTSGFLNPDVVAGQFVAYEPGFPRAFIVSLGLARLP